MAFFFSFSCAGQGECWWRGRYYQIGIANRHTQFLYLMEELVINNIARKRGFIAKNHKRPLARCGPEYLRSRIVLLGLLAFPCTDFHKVLFHCDGIWDVFTQPKHAGRELAARPVPAVTHAKGEGPGEDTHPRQLGLVPP